MTKLVVTIMALILCLSLSAWAQDKAASDNPAGAAAPGGGCVVLNDGPITVCVDSFGRAGHGLGLWPGFFVAGPSVLYEHQDFISAGGGAVTEISPAGGCAVLSAIAVGPPNHGSSVVQCGPCAIYFDHYVTGIGASGGIWQTTVQIQGCDVPCYYSYTDYDVNGPPNNDGSFQPGVLPSLGQFVVRNNVVSPTIEYFFRDEFNAAHWAQGTYPNIRNAIATLPQCRDLPDNPFLALNTDWTGAIEYQGLNAFRYSHGRDDSLPFP